METVDKNEEYCTFHGIWILEKNIMESLGQCAPWDKSYSSISGASQDYPMCAGLYGLEPDQFIVPLTASVTSLFFTLMGFVKK